MVIKKFITNEKTNGAAPNSGNIEDGSTIQFGNLSPSLKVLSASQLMPYKTLLLFHSSRSSHLLTNNHIVKHDLLCIRKTYPIRT